MTKDSAHLGERINRPAADVYAYVADPANLPEWAPGLATAVERSDGDWYVTFGAARARVTFAPPNDFGVLDHEVTLPTGETFLNPVRVVPYGEGSEIVFSVRRLPGVSDEEFTRDTTQVTSDLARLRTILESR
ncbi:MAG: SRPBCC family protein [Actinoplanes sp.]